MSRVSVCLSCKKSFDQKELGSTYHYCSIECHKSVSEPLKKKCPPTELKCELCENNFFVINRLTAKYCSDKCRSLARYRKLIGKSVKGKRTKGEYGKGYITKSGYKAIYRDHPNANKKTRIILEHTFVMSEFLGRPIRKGETVHHINGIRSDNRIENLQLWTSRHPSGVNYHEKIKSAIEFLKEEGYKVTKE